MRRTWIGLPAACVLLAGLALARAGEAPPLKMSEEEGKLLELVNAERKKEELAPLRPNPLVFKLGRDHSANMAKQEKMAHDLDDKTPFDRMKAAGYRYQRAAENIAGGSEGVPLTLFVENWMKSEGHRKN